MIRKSIEAELKRRGWTTYRLVQHVRGEIPPATVYAYLAGTRDLTTQRADILLKALGLTIRRARNPR